MNIVGRRKLWFSISILLILPGTIALLVWGLKPGIDFTGGQEMEIAGDIGQSELSELVSKAGAKDITVTTSGGDRLIVRYSDKDAGESQQLRQNISALLKQRNLQETSFSSVGPSVSRDITARALLGVGLASLAILLYVAFAFRNTPPPVSPWSFGATAIIALLHDALFLLGIFAILGHFFDVQDTIVVYDRIRENLRRHNKPFEEIVNISINETLARSLNTSITVIIVLLAFFMFGGESIRYFVLALLIGIISGTYSSIFNASPLLVVYNNWKIKKSKANNKSKGNNKSK